MKTLIRFLRNNTIKLIGVVAGLMTIIFGWERLCDDVLFTSVTLPVYVYLIFLFVVVVVAALAIKFWPATQATPATPATKDRPKELKIIKGETFGTQRITLDGKRFVNCTFMGTEFAYWGNASTIFDNCGFDLGHQSFVFEGSAINTIIFLKNLYSQEVFRPFVDHVFESIKAGKLPRAIPPSDAADD